MKYFPVLQELFEADTVFLLIVGMIISVIVCLKLKNLKKCIKGMIVSAVIYVICEIISNMHTNFLLEIILLFIGTFAIGCGIGFLICILIGLLKGEQTMRKRHIPILFAACLLLLGGCKDAQIELPQGETPQATDIAFQL